MQKDMKSLEKEIADLEMEKRGKEKQLRGGGFGEDGEGETNQLVLLKERQL